jgi:hypothetical protein
MESCFEKSGDRACQLVAGQLPAEKEEEKKKTNKQTVFNFLHHRKHEIKTKRRAIQIGQRSKLSKLCWKGARKLVIVQPPAKRWNWVDLKEKEQKPKSKTREKYKLINEVSCPICVGMVPESWLLSKCL